MKNTKSILSAIFASLVLCLSASAEDSSYSITHQYSSEYVYRGQKISDQAIQTTIDASRGSLDVGLWANTAFKKTDGQPEIDLYGTYTVTINDSLSFQPGFLFYTYQNAPKADGWYQYTFEPSLSLSYVRYGVTFKPTFYYDTVLKAKTYELNTSYVLPVKLFKSELDLSATIGTDLVGNYSRDNTRSWGNYWQLGVSMPFIINRNNKIAVGYNYNRGTGYTKQARDPKEPNATNAGTGVYTFAYTFSF